MGKVLQPVAIAVGAHPDDIEFGMAGTLLLLRQRGWQVHYLNLANGSCGSRKHSAAKLIQTRRQEAQASAKVLGAAWHPSFVSDLEILYSVPLLRKVAGVLREVHPSIVLTHPPQDYMEDHMNTCRLVVTAAFSLGMPNFRTTPRRRAVSGDVTLYHCLPHGQRDGLGNRVEPNAYVNTESVHATKLAALAKHQSQQDWLENSQGMNSYLATLDQMSREVGRLSGRFTHAEGWLRHSHLGFSAAGIDPLREALGSDYLVRRPTQKHA